MYTNALLVLLMATRAGAAKFLLGNFFLYQGKTVGSKTLSFTAQTNAGDRDNEFVEYGKMLQKTWGETWTEGIQITLLASDPDTKLPVAEANIASYDRTKTYAFLVGPEAEQETTGGWMSSNQLGTESPSLLFTQDQATTAYCVNLALGGKGIATDQPSATFSFKSRSTASADVQFLNFNTVGASAVSGGWENVRSYGAQLDGEEVVDATKDAPVCTAFNPVVVTNPDYQYFTTVLYGPAEDRKLASYRELQYEERTGCMPVPTTAAPPEEEGGSSGLIVGVVVAVLVALVLVGGIFIFMKKKRQASFGSDKQIEIECGQETEVLVTKDQEQDTREPSTEKEVQVATESVEVQVDGEEEVTV